MTSALPVSLPFDSIPGVAVLANSLGELQWLSPAARELAADKTSGSGGAVAPPIRLGDLFGESVAKLVVESSAFRVVPLTMENDSPTRLEIFPLPGSDIEELFFCVVRHEPPKRGALPDFFDTVAHDVQNPLFVVMGMADALLDGRSVAQLEGNQGLYRIRSAALRALEVVRNYRMLSSLAQNPWHVSLPALKPLDIGEQLQGILDTFWRPDERRVTLSLPTEPVCVRLERTMVDRVLSNLITNALKFTPPGDPISISLARRDGHVEFSIHNPRPWIPPEEQTRLFEVGFRGEASRDVPGSGLGLAIVRQLLNGCGGKITVESTEASGTRFTVEFPIQQLPAAQG